ncbi:hypothetical protein HDV06_001496, partial [Boothiomyces sp. JEL0866]
MSWAWKPVRMAAEGTLQEENYPAVPRSSKLLVKRMDEYFARVNEYHKGIRPALPNLYFFLAKIFLCELGTALLVKIISTVLLAVKPLAIGQLIAYLDPNTTVSLWFQNPIYICAILISLSLLIPILAIVFQNLTTIFMARFFEVANTMFFEKAMRLGSKSRIIYEAGYLISVYNRDLDRLQNALQLVYSGLSPLLYIIINLILLFTIIKWSVVYSMLSILLILLFSYYVSSKANQMIAGFNIILDERMKVLREVIGGIRNVKISNMAAHYLDILDKSTDKFISIVSKYYIITRIRAATSNSASGMLAAITFISFYLSGHSIDPALVFPAYLYLDAIAAQLLQLNPLMTQIMNVPEIIAILSDFLCSEEISPPVQRVYKESVAIKTINVKW